MTQKPIFPNGRAWAKHAQIHAQMHAQMTQKTGNTPTKCKAIDKCKKIPYTNYMVQQ